ncbi:extracellular zinc metalloproteinase [Lactobacillus selangorensis]|uniref:Extracellular zinc metalloproteinase n=1 Tax=Lactobacillus selangorensis TaxID=81857 RepID=A0A0R2FJ77_9LACO|nr:extracellular zinc metalloproteinase [Lactobacillus selangorensis]KRN32871.1 extracellular zinc metalloproteinase [Lactobacillus selangorensis]
MKFFRRIVILLLLLVGIGWTRSHPQVVASTARHYLTAAAAKLPKAAENLRPTASTASSASSSSTSQTEISSASSSVATSADATPVESIVQNAHLNKVYGYHFAKGTPAAAKKVFLDAVAVYNQTGIVQLKADEQAKNQITFSVYHKQMANALQTGIELGVGGPQITQETSWQGTTSTNNARARLNATYSAAFSDSVAIHELGHALGLDHSSDLSSVMYPVDQGVTTLSTGDSSALKEIYQ